MLLRPAVQGFSKGGLEMKLLSAGRAAGKVPFEFDLVRRLKLPVQVRVQKPF